MWWTRFMLGPDEGGGGGGGEPEPKPEPEAKPDPEPKPDPKPKGAKFLSQLSPERREKYKKELEEFEGGIGDAWDELMTARTRLSRSIIVPDKDKPDPEDLKSFKRAFGIVDKPEDYGLKPEKGAEAFTDRLAKTAMSLGLNKNQAAGFHKFVNTVSKEALASRAKAAKEQEDGFEPAILKAVDNDETKKTEALNLYKRFMTTKVADSGIIKRLVDAGLFFDPKFAMAMVKTERASSEEQFVDGRRGRPDGKKSGAYSDQFRQQYGERKS